MKSGDSEFKNGGGLLLVVPDLTDRSSKAFSSHARAGVPRATAPSREQRDRCLERRVPSLRDSSDVVEAPRPFSSQLSEEDPWEQIVDWHVGTDVGQNSCRLNRALRKRIKFAGRPQAGTKHGVVERAHEPGEAGELAVTDPGEPVRITWGFPLLGIDAIVDGQAEQRNPCLLGVQAQASDHKLGERGSFVVSPRVPVRLQSRMASLRSGVTNRLPA